MNAKGRRTATLEAAAMAYFKTGNNPILLKCSLAETENAGARTAVSSFGTCEALDAFKFVHNKFFTGRQLPTVRLAIIVAKTSKEVRDQILFRDFDGAGLDDDVFIIAS